MKVPDVLLSGDHARIKQWRREQAAQRRVPQGVKR
jgi:tRNA (guanine-N1)-methyltransferase